jgi:hypothetical protein
MAKKISLEDITEEQLGRAREIVHEVIRSLSMPCDPRKAESVLKMIINLSGKTGAEGVGGPILPPNEEHIGQSLLHDLSSESKEANYDFILKENGLKLRYCGLFWAYWLSRYLIGEVFGVKFDRERLFLLMNFVKYCPIVFSNEKNEVFGVKPSKLRWRISGESEAPLRLPLYELHADGETAVECLGVKLYFFQNLRIPDCMGMVKSSEWKPEWVLKEDNAEIRRLLLQVIPREKIASVLDLVVLDTYQSSVSCYELVEARNNPYPSPYRALRMSCPSTDKPYLVRVRPDMISAEKAVIELNGGIHPDTFLVEH